MSNYCTNCKWLGKKSIANKTQWLCKRGSEWCSPDELQSLCGNPVKHNICIKDNWYEAKNKSEVNKLVKEYCHSSQFVFKEMLKQEKKMTNYCMNCNELKEDGQFWFCIKDFSKRVLCKFEDSPYKSIGCINGNWYKETKQKEKKMNTKEIIEVMQAYVNGKQIEISSDPNEGWSPAGQDFIPSWNWELYTWRIKPKYRPLKPEELVELKDKWLKNKINGVLAMVVGIDFYENRIYLYGTKWNAYELKSTWTYEDGTPISKLEEN